MLSINLAANETDNDRFFNPWRTPGSTELSALCDDLISSLYGYEDKHKLRQRRRRETSRSTFELTVKAVICDLVHALLREDDRGTAVTRSKQVLGRRSRYRSPALNDMLPDIIDLLAKPELNWLTQELGYEDHKAKRNQRTLVWPTTHLQERVIEYGVKLHHIEKVEGEEIIILKSPKRRQDEDGEDEYEDYKDKGERVEYDDTPLTQKLRREVEDINKWISTADIRQNGEKVSRSDLVLRRHFTQGSFTSGGRLFGAFWQGMTKAERRAELTINGEAIAALDYRQMAIRILYGMVGIIPDDDDLYHIPGISDLPDGLTYRPGIKMVMNSMTFRDGRLNKKPKESSQVLPRHITIQEIEERIRARHPELDDLFGTMVGHECQFIESNILIDIIMRLKDRGITCLPIHDCILVGRSHMDTAIAVMTEASNSVLGFPIPVEQE